MLTQNLEHLEHLREFGFCAWHVMHLDCRAVTEQEDGKVFAWFVHIGESDLEVIEKTVWRCRESFEARRYFVGLADELTIAPAPTPEVIRGCATCANRRGRAGYWFGCPAREDLPRMFGVTHPLRTLPPDGGVDCELWKLTAPAVSGKHERETP